MRMQERWFVGGNAVSQEQIKLLKALPIFPTPAAAAGEGPSTLSGASTPSVAAHVDLLDRRFLPPAGTDVLLLRGTAFLLPAPPGESRVLAQRLGVVQLSAERFLVDHLLPRRAPQDWSYSWHPRVVRPC